MMKTAVWCRNAILAVTGTLLVCAGLHAQVKVTTPLVPLQGVKKPAIKADSATHTPASTIKVRSEDGKLGIQTLTVDGAGRLLALVAPSRSYAAPRKDVSSEVHVFSPEGKKLATWKVDFHANSINTAPDGSVFVAGDGKVACFDAAGKQTAQVELPHIAALVKDNAEMRKQAEARLKLQKDSFERAKTNIKQLVDKLKAKKEEDRTAQEKTRLLQYEQILKNYEQNARSYQTMTVESIMAGMTGRLRVINGIAASEKDVFVACGETQGYGYAVWRMDHSFKNPKQVLSGLRGCCSQMDIQTSGTDILVAENTKHQFARYDRDGKPLGRWGKRGTDSEGDCFGGRCNPMNLRCGKSGDIFTAESEGIIKRYDPKGEFKGLVGVARLSGGCKNVTVAVSPDASKVYLCDQPGSGVIILEKNK